MYIENTIYMEGLEMELKMEKIDWIFLLFCLLAGIVAEESFFRYQIGISYFVFIAIFILYFSGGFDRFHFHISVLDICVDCHMDIGSRLLSI